MFKNIKMWDKFSKEPAFQHGFNAAIDKLIRGCGAEISSKTCDK